MMLPLLPDVADGVFNLGMADAECAVALLPGKPTAAGEFFVDPFGGNTFDALDGLCQRQHRRDGKQDVDMVFDAADGRNSHATFHRYGYD